jgi:hypothetical protein
MDVSLHHAAEFKRIIAVVKALRGEIYGECVRDVLTYDALRAAGVDSIPQSLMRVVRARFNDPRARHSLVAVLRIDHVVVEDDDPGNNAASLVVHLRPPAGGSGTMTLSQTPCCQSQQSQHIAIVINDDIRTMWRARRPSFDIDCLASTRTSTYVYTLPSPYDPPNLIDTIVHRIMMRRFCLAQLGPSVQQTSRAARDALDLVRSGWTMDDSYMGALNRSWVAAMWCNVPRARSCTDECTICQERFMPSDAVIVLPCGHVFHGFCDQKYCTGGLCSWLDGNSTCPCCRRQVAG